MTATPHLKAMTPLPRYRVGRAAHRSALPGGRFGPLVFRDIARLRMDSAFGGKAVMQPRDSHDRV
jgi:hypothetical protein